jgi:serine/threonine-protein kinase
MRLPEPGEIVSNKYRIEQWLGQGGMGAVFRATQLLSEKPVALKWMLRPSSLQARARFLREARAAGRIRHPNVVDIYDVGRDGETDYLVMELLSGESLRARLDRGELAMTEAVDLLLPAMHGIAAAHRAAVIHRDLKPDNVFLCEASDGRAAEAKVLDFGISQITSAGADDPAITREGAVLGTPVYMSPEQLKDARDVDVRTDVYSCGVILYEAITGRLPFSEASFSGLVLAIAQTDPPAPSSLVPDLPPAFEQVLLRAIARDRDRRFANMDSFIAAVRPFGARYLHGRVSPRTRQGAPLASDGGEPTAARRSGHVRRHSWPWAALGIAMVAALLAAWWLGRPDRTPPAAAPLPLPARVAGAVAQPVVADERATRSQLPASAGEPATALPDVGATDAVEVPRPGMPRPARMPPVRRDARRTHARVTATTGSSPAGGDQPVGRSGTISLDDM